jgi:hypothetical protein
MLIKLIRLLERSLVLCIYSMQDQTACKTFEIGYKSSTSSVLKIDIIRDFVAQPFNHLH